jgi:hypothetical protein
MYKGATKFEFKLKFEFGKEEKIKEKKIKRKRNETPNWASVTNSAHPEKPLMRPVQARRRSMGPSCLLHSPRACSLPRGTHKSSPTSGKIACAPQRSSEFVACIHHRVGVSGSIGPISMQVLPGFTTRPIIHAKVFHLWRCAECGEEPEPPQRSCCLLSTQCQRWCPWTDSGLGVKQWWSGRLDSAVNSSGGAYRRLGVHYRPQAP